MYLYSIMPLDTAHVDEVVSDIAGQYREGIATCALFCMTMVPEGDPPVDKAGIFCEKFDLFRDRLAAQGMKCGILVQASIGHGYALNHMFPFQRYVNLTDGKEENIVCPYDEDFRAHFRRNMHVLASHRPEIIMVDDDFRLMFRPGRGCACPRHMAEFNRRLGRKIPVSREELYAAIRRNDEEGKAWRDLFIETQRESLLGAARQMRAGIDEVDPHLPGAFCLAGNSGEFGDEIANILAGEGNPSILRFNNGYYTPVGARNLTVPMFRAATQIAILRDKVDVLLAETDTCPQNRYSTGAQSLHSHFTGSILEGAMGAKHWITRLHAHEPASGKAYRRMLGKHRGMYEALSALVPGLRPFGCRIPLSGRPDYRLAAEDIWTIGADGWPTCVLERMGLPMYFSKDPGGAVFLDGDADEKFTDEEIRDMLAGVVFLASDTAEHLIRRGFGADLGVDVRAWTGLHPSGERLHVNGNECSTQIGIRELLPLSPDTEALSTVFHVPDGKTEIPLFPGVTRYRNGRGGTVVVFCGTPKAAFHYSTAFSFLNESRKLQLVSVLSDCGQLPLYYPEDAEVYLRAGELPDGSVFCAFFNLGFDLLEEIPLCVARPVSTVERMMNDGSWSPVPFTAEDGCLRVETCAATLDPVLLRLS